MTTNLPTVIRVYCQDCGDVEAPVEGAVITAHGTERRCTFTCPVCTVPAASKLLTTALVDALTAEGVPTVTLPVRTLPASTLPRILPPDVVKFTCELAGTDYLAGAE